MSSALMIFINEHEKFDFSSTVRAISNLDNVEALIIKEDNSEALDPEGSVLLCTYRYEDEITNVSLDEDLSFIVAERTGYASIDFALKLQSVVDIPLTAVDTGYNYQIKLKKINSIQEFEDIASFGIYME